MVQRVVPADELDGAVDHAVRNLLQCAPGALATIKRLPGLIAGDADLTRHIATALLAERLASEEGQEGLRAFLEKRPAAWVPPA